MLNVRKINKQHAKQHMQYSSWI